MATDIVVRIYNPFNGPSSVLLVEHTPDAFKSVRERLLQTDAKETPSNLIEELYHLIKRHPKCFAVAEWGKFPPEGRVLWNRVWSDASFRLDWHPRGRRMERSYWVNVIQLLEGTMTVTGHGTPPFQVTAPATFISSAGLRKTSGDIEGSIEFEGKDVDVVVSEHMSYDIYHTRKAAELYAVVVFLCDDLLRPKTKDIPAAESKAARFFAQAQRLPMELQQLLCCRCFCLTYDSVPPSWSDHAFAKLARTLRREERDANLSTEK